MAEATEVRERIIINPLKTIEDVRRAERDLSLLAYILTPKAGAKFDEPQRTGFMPCSVCNVEASTSYHFRDHWYCAAHYPGNVTWPIGMHGDDLKQYKEKK